MGWVDSRKGKNKKPPEIFSEGLVYKNIISNYSARIQIAGSIEE